MRIGMNIIFDLEDFAEELHRLGSELTLPTYEQLADLCSLHKITGPSAEEYRLFVEEEGLQPAHPQPAHPQPAQGVFDRFLSACTEPCAGEILTSLALYSQLTEWLAQHGESWAPSPNKMAAELKMRGFQPARKRLHGSNPQTIYTGLRLHTDLKENSTHAEEKIPTL